MIGFAFSGINGRDVGGETMVVRIAPKFKLNFTELCELDAFSLNDAIFTSSNALSVFGGTNT